MVYTPDTVALFYDGFETQALDRPFGMLQSETRRLARATWRTIRRRQVNTGFFTAFLNLKSSLEAHGITVRVNDFAYARAHPGEPIGLSGFAKVFERVRLPNPAVFGPGYVPPPSKVEEVMVACNIKVVTFPSEWPCQMWRGTIGDAAQPMFVAIDIEAWPDMSDHHKSCDILVYDKIRWRQTERTEDLRRPLYSALEQRNLSYRVLRYGEHHIGQFRDALRHCRAMVFLCEHETQGLAYQEAMSSGVPILAWDEGELVDPHERAFAPPGLVVSSVPYFDARCGTTFTRETLQQQLEAFLGNLGTFRPREYVVDTLSPAAGAARYLNLLEQASRAK